MKADVPLGLHTTLGIGGKADLFYEARDSLELVKAVRLSKSLGIPVTIIGGGSNILVGDKGVRGLVVKNVGGVIKIGKDKEPIGALPEEVGARWQADSTVGSFKYDFADLDYDEWDEKRVEVVVDSGVPLSVLMMSMADAGVTGLQWYSRIPGTVGGAIFNNIHGGTHTIGEVVEGVKLIDRNGEIREISSEALGMGYDVSRFHNSGEIILEVKFNLFRGDVDKSRWVIGEWAKRKSIQPGRSAGCVFKNIADADKERLGLPTGSVGYLVEHVLKLSGFRVGDAAVSDAHKNFIVNVGSATASDFVGVRTESVMRAKEKCGIDLESEIILMGEF